MSDTTDTSSTDTGDSTPVSTSSNSGSNSFTQIDGIVFGGFFLVIMFFFAVGKMCRMWDAWQSSASQRRRLPNLAVTKPVVVQMDPVVVQSAVVQPDTLMQPDQQIKPEQPEVQPLKPTQVENPESTAYPVSQKPITSTPEQLEVKPAPLISQDHIMPTYSFQVEPLSLHQFDFDEQDLQLEALPSFAELAGKKKK